MSYLLRMVPYATLMTVLVGVVFGVASMRQAQRMRTLQAAVQLVHAVQTPEFTHAIRRILELPEDAEPHLVLCDGEMIASAYIVSHVFESLGVLVFYRLLPLHLVDNLIGGYTRASWHRLEAYVGEQRILMGPMFGEWFQWLAERMEEHPAPGKLLGAAVAHRDWRL